MNGSFQALSAIFILLISLKISNLGAEISTELEEGISGFKFIPSNPDWNTSGTPTGAPISPPKPAGQKIGFTPMLVAENPPASIPTDPIDEPELIATAVDAIPTEIPPPSIFIEFSFLRVF